jgi:hypothetical protein
MFSKLQFLVPATVQRHHRLLMHLFRYDQAILVLDHFLRILTQRQQRVYLILQMVPAHQPHSSVLDALSQITLH